MKKKQLIGLIIACVIFFITGVLSLVTTSSISNSFKKILLDETSSLDDYEISTPSSNYIGVLNIVGEISETSQSSSFLSSSSSTYDHDLYMDYVEQCMYDKKNKGLVLYVNSPGGSVYASDELYLKIMEYKEKTNRPVYAYFASQACSGGYYISMCADKIYANRNCWTGSIGVIISMYNYKDLLDKLGVKEVDITSGPNKAMGSAGLEMTDEQRQILQGLVDEAYEQFVSIVSKGRKLDIATVKEIADGRIYSAAQAKKLGLIDECGSFEDMKNAMCSANSFNSDIEFHIPSSPYSSSFLSMFEKIKDLKPKTESESISELLSNDRSGVLMYYAK